MQISLSASGSPESVKTSLRTQAEAQLGAAGLPCHVVVADVLAYVDSETQGKTSATVSVSLNIGITVS